jgi:hypothetical protein
LKYDVAPAAPILSGASVSLGAMSHASRASWSRSAPLL